MKTAIKVKTHFDAAHRLEGYEGKCKNLHGHRWDVISIFSGPIGDVNMIVDFKKIKEKLNEIMPDHLCLNEFYHEENPTAEVLAQTLFRQIEEMVSAEGLPLSLEQVELFESPECSVMVRP